VKSICNSNHRSYPWLATAFALGATIFAAVQASLVEASAFLPVFLGIYLLERNKQRVERR
jgi:hypothetical protein